MQIKMCISWYRIKGSIYVVWWKELMVKGSDSDSTLITNWKVLHPVPVFVGVAFFPHQAILQKPAGYPAIQLNSDAIYLEIVSDPTGLNSISPKHCSPPPCSQMLIESLDFHLGFWPIGYKLEVPKTPSLYPVNLLELLTELWNNYLLDYWFIMKGYNSGIARWKRYLGLGMEKGGTSMPSPGIQLFLNLHVLSHPEALWISSFGFYGGLNYISMID